MDEKLRELNGMVNEKIERRPFNELCRKDGNFNYIHQTDVFVLVERALNEGHKYQPALEHLRSVIPETYGDAIAKYKWLKCEPHEWDNRTYLENIEYVLIEASALSCGEHKASAPCPHYRSLLRLKGGDIVECVHPECGKWPQRTELTL